ncbi:MAG: polysaccharide deacetylase family protein [Candidatus Woesearchaeota archaeon]
MKELYCFLTNDVESISLVTNDIKKENAIKVYEQGLPRLLELYDEFQVRATFFFTGEIIEKVPGVIKLIDIKKHEIASHGYSHEVDEAFDVLSFEKQKEHLIKSKKIIEDLTGQEVTSFRAPALRVNKFTPKALLETGFNIDSSIASQRFDFFLSFGSIKKLNRFFAPRLPYFTDEKDLTKKGNSEILEIPISALIFPYIGTTLRIFPKITSLVRNLLILEAKFDGKPINFLTHPNEFLDEEIIKLKTKKRTKNFLSYLLADKLRYYLKLKNLGLQGLNLYRKEIEWLKMNNFKFVTMKEFRKLIINKRLKNEG